MVTLQAIKDALAGLGIAYTYRVFVDDQPATPFLVYYVDSERGLHGSDIPIACIGGLTIELYTNNKDSALEARLEAALLSLGLLYDKDELWLENERAYEIVYSTEFWLTKEEENG